MKRIILAIMIAVVVSVPSGIALAALIPERETDHAPSGTSSQTTYNNGVVATSNPREFYRFGGGRTTGFCDALTCTSQTQKYNIDTGVTTSLASLDIRTFFRQQTYVNHGDDIFAIPVAFSGSALRHYDASLNTWSTLAAPAVNMALNCPSSGGGCVMVAAENIAYFISRSTHNAGSCSGSHLGLFAASFDMTTPGGSWTCLDETVAVTPTITEGVATYDATQNRIYYTGTVAGVWHLLWYDINTDSFASGVNLSTVYGITTPAVFAFTQNGSAFIGFRQDNASTYETIDLYRIFQGNLTLIETWSDSEFAYLDAALGNRFAVASTDSTIFFGSRTSVGSNSAQPTANRWWSVSGALPIAAQSSTCAIEDCISGWGAFLGANFFVGIVAVAILFVHLAWRIPFELLYPFGFVIGAILSHETVGILDPSWIISAIALVAALYLYKWAFSNGSNAE